MVLLLLLRVSVLLQPSLHPPELGGAMGAGPALLSVLLGCALAAEPRLQRGM